MADQITVRVADGRRFYHRGEGVYTGGDEFHIDADLAANYPNTLEQLEDPDPDSDGDAMSDGRESDTDAPIDPSEYTIDGLSDALADSDYTDAELSAIADAEADGKDRDGALEAIDDARADTDASEAAVADERTEAQTGE